MNKSSGVLLACVLALVAGALWFWPPAGDLAPATDLEAPAASEPGNSTLPAMANTPASRSSVRPTPKARAAAPEAGADQITGVVVAEEGEPVSAAQVTLRLVEAEPTETIASTKADDQGRFEFSGVERRGNYVIRAEHPDLLPDEAQAQAGQKVRLSLLPGGVLHGIVTGSDRQPLPGVRLSLRLPMQHGAWAGAAGRRSGSVWLLRTATATTDARGEYRLAPVPRRPGTELWLTPPSGHLPESRDLVDEPGERRLDITLASGFPLRCQVLDAQTRAPIAGAEVRYELAEPVARSGADGTLVLHVPLGTMRQLHVAAAGYAAIEHNLKVERTDLDRTLVLLLPRGARLTGRVVDEAGAPVAGARLRLTQMALPPGREADRQRAARAAMPELARHSRYRGIPWPANEVADGQGRYAFEGLAGRNGVFHGQLTVRRQGFCDSVPEPIDMDLPAQDRVVNVTLSRGGMIEGTVRHQGKPVRAFVRATSNQRTLVASTNANGEFVIGPILPGQALVTGQAGERAGFGGFRIDLLGIASQDVHVTEGARLQVTLDIPPGDETPRTATATISGRVVDPQGKGVPGIPIRFERDDPGGSGGGLAPAPTDAYGQFSIQVPTAEGQATYTVTAVADGSSKPHARVRPPRQDLKFEVSGNSRVTLEVACADGDSPSNVNVFTRPATGGPWIPYQKELADRGSTTVLEANEVLSIPGGEVDLRVDVLGYVPAEVLGVRVNRGANPVRVVVHRGHAILLMPTGAVEALDGREVVLVRAETTLPEGPVQGDSFRRLRHEGGQLQARTLGPGRYRLVSTDRDLSFDPEVFEVKDQDVAGQVRITLTK